MKLREVFRLYENLSKPLVQDYFMDNKIAYAITANLKKIEPIIKESKVNPSKEVKEYLTELQAVQNDQAKLIELKDKWKKEAEEWTAIEEKVNETDVDFTPYTVSATLLPKTGVTPSQLDCLWEILTDKETLEEANNGK